MALAAIGHTPTSAPAFDQLSLGDVFDLVQDGLRHLSQRMSTPDARREFAVFIAPESTPDDAPSDRVPTNQDPVDRVRGDVRNTLPSLLQSAQSTAQLIAGVQARLDGFTHDMFARPQDRADLLGLPKKGKLAYRDASELIQGATNISRHEAKRRTQQAQDFRPHASKSGSKDTPPPGSGRLAGLLPQVASAFARSLIAPARLSIITAAIDKLEKVLATAGLPVATLHDQLRDVDERMAYRASVESHDEFRSFVNHWRDSVLRLIADDAVTSAEHQARENRSLVYMGQSGELFDWLVRTTREGHETLMTIKSASSNPRRRSSCATDESESDSTSDSTASAEEPTDDRSPVQRAHDGFFGVVEAGLRSTENSLPDQGGSRPQLIVSAGITSLLKMAHQDGLLADTFDPQLLNTGSTEDLMISAGYSGSSGAGIIRRMLCTADITPVVLGTDSEILDVGKKHRLFTPAQRKALIARDGGCAAPGCTFPAAWCESHHIQPWSQGGKTSVDNGVLLCSHHHHAVHEGAWSIRVYRGSPWFTPTAKLNLFTIDRSPRRNNYWRPDRESPPPPDEADLADTAPADADLSNADPSDTGLSETHPMPLS